MTTDLMVLFDIHYWSANKNELPVKFLDHLRAHAPELAWPPSFLPNSDVTLEAYLYRPREDFDLVRTSQSAIGLDILG